LGLRSAIGIEKAILTQRIHHNAKELCTEGKLTETLTHYYNTDYFISDALALYLLE